MSLSCHGLVHVSVLLMFLIMFAKVEQMSSCVRSFLVRLCHLRLCRVVLGYAILGHVVSCDVNIYKKLTTSSLRWWKDGMGGEEKRKYFINIIVTVISLICSHVWSWKRICVQWFTVVSCCFCYCWIIVVVVVSVVVIVVQSLLLAFVLLLLL